MAYAPPSEPPDPVTRPTLEAWVDDGRLIVSEPATDGAWMMADLDAKTLEIRL